jgi:hypothetical protein
MTQLIERPVLAGLLGREFSGAQVHAAFCFAVRELPARLRSGGTRLLKFIPAVSQVQTDYEQISVFNKLNYMLVGQRLGEAVCQQPLSGGLIYQVQRDCFGYLADWEEGTRADHAFFDYMACYLSQQSRQANGKE